MKLSLAFANGHAEKYELAALMERDTTQMDGLRTSVVRTYILLPGVFNKPKISKVSEMAGEEKLPSLIAPPDEFIKRIMIFSMFDEDDGWR